VAAEDPDSVHAEGRREEGKLARRSRIVRAARDLIRETGDTDLSMRMIAQRAGVSLATPYNLFGSKHAVVLAVFEDERDFAQRFGKLKAANAIDRIFDAHALAMGYYTDDPDFYRPLWRALLDTQGADTTGLATPERLERNRAAWRMLIEAAQAEELLERSISADLLERTLTLTAYGAMFSWAMGMLPTDELLASAGLGYALTLQGAATPAGAKILERRIDGYKELMSASPRSVQAASRSKRLAR
jgi:AcrR family transcriptional regulator